MRPLVTPEQMGAADSATIAAGTPGEMLMERAGRAVATVALRAAGGRYGKRAVVVCGKGNNGGDGFVAARVLLHEGLAVRCLFVGELSTVEGDAALHLARLQRAGGRVDPFTKKDLPRADVIVDALFGTGFRGQAEGLAADAIEAINSSGAPIVAVDVPSGVEGRTGNAAGPAIAAEATVAMGAEKIGTAVGTGATLAGFVEVADIGIGIPDVDAHIAEEQDVVRVLPERAPDSHKRSVGSVALLCGSEGMSGAAILSAKGAIRMGAGYATLGVPSSIEPIVSTALPEVLTSIVTDEAHLGPESLASFKPVLERADSLAAGPGLGQGEDQRELVKEILSRVAQPVVLDADALNVLAGNTSVLRERSGSIVLTPHPAELARLLERETSAIQGDRVSAASEAAAAFDCIVVLKGYRTVIAEPGGRIVVNPAGSSHLATAGTGDVLTGAVAAFLAAGLDPFDAAWAAAFVHGLAGEIAAARLGGRGVIAGDVADALPKAVSSVGVVVT